MANDPTLSTDQNNALGSLNTWLGQFNLGSLNDTIKNWIIQGYSPDRIQLEITNTDQFKQAFPEYQARINKGLPPMSPADILNYRAQTTQILRNAGLPQGFYDSPDDFVDLVTKDLSPAELQSRVANGYAQVANAPQEVKDTFAEYFGAQGPGMLASFFLDPTKGGDVIQKAVTEAQIGGFGKQLGFSVDQNQAQKYAEQGISGAQAQQGFQQAYQLSALADSTMGETTDMSKEQIAQGVLTGGQAEADTKRRLAERGAQFRQGYGGSGGGSQGQTGIGVGGSPQT